MDLLRKRNFSQRFFYNLCPVVGWMFLFLPLGAVMFAESPLMGLLPGGTLRIVMVFSPFVGVGD